MWKKKAYATGLKDTTTMMAFVKAVHGIFQTVVQKYCRDVASEVRHKMRATRYVRIREK